MSRLVKTLLLLGILGGTVAVAYMPTRQYLQRRNRVAWETAPVIVGDLTHYVESTGTVRPVLSVSVGSFVSGPIVELNVDFNDEVHQGDVLARVDPRLFEASVQRDRATLQTQQARLQSVEARLQQALNNFQRGQQLRKKNRDYLSDREMDALTFEVKSLQAERQLARASIQQAEASLETSQANLDYCLITAPVDGLVIDRKIDPGQTLAAQFQTPELFVVAPDLRKKVHIFASVDEADIGLIQQAEVEQRPVTFTVDAHRDFVFDGVIEQIRVSSQSTQNVVTYPVVIAAANPDLRLLPGMTASISFEVDSAEEVLKIPNAALRFFPEDARNVRPADRYLIDGSRWQADGEDSPDAADDDESLSAIEKVERAKNRNRRHVWVVQGQQLRAVEVVIGLRENQYTELLEGDLSANDELVTARKE